MNRRREESGRDESGGDTQESVFFSSTSFWDLLVFDRSHWSAQAPVMLLEIVLHLTRADFNTRLGRQLGRQILCRSVGKVHPSFSWLLFDQF